ncbi:MAG: acyl-CoA dehydratase activase-related protein [Ruminococcus sp.]|jgi:predicted CoA-substrate-specific enzyme activase|nr:acyl-CoA dehydratase activase-related protein [Ruminococcus sp.]
MEKLFVGVDVGSTTVKICVIDENLKTLYTKYERHFSKVRETVVRQLREAGEFLRELLSRPFALQITGSAGLGIAEAANLPFVQEVYAAYEAVEKRFPETDVVIELGGEDAKIIFLTGGIEQRMNGSCAGGTGAFIDQMATLLGISADELDNLALNATKVYSIASRCGVFAKSDIQPLLNQGAKHEDIAASVFQAVVDQTVSGLAQGRTIEGKVLFLGGPLSFLKALRTAFIKTLNLSDENAIFPEDATTFMAYGAALSATETFTLEEITEKIEKLHVNTGIITSDPLFADEDEYKTFLARHGSVDVRRADINTYSGNAYLGVDAGSTTTKLTLISEDCALLYSHYAANMGKPLDVIAGKLAEIYELCGDRITIKASAVTGYGEDLIKAGLGLDFGIVETVAHFNAASFFEPEVDFIIDIGGQDIKCFKLKNKAIDSIMLNEACSSGCGSFIQTFARALGYGVEEFSKLGLFASHPVDLGSRCTVFMNSSVKQAQKDGATVGDISAGISSSVIKNAVYKVIRAKNTEELGKHIVVQGGTFLNDAVLRAFEIELGRNVVRPAIAGLMGAFGAALYAKNNTPKGKLITAEELGNFSYKSKQANCAGCTSKCSLTVITFADGHRFISGNRCEKGAGLQKASEELCLFEYKYKLLLSRAVSHVKETTNTPKAKVGLPLALGLYEQLPFWVTFFNELGFETILSEETTRDTYYKGQHTIPSDTVCYPAKLAHGACLSLLERGADFIFFPCETYNKDEGGSDNHYNCPVVAYYPELLKGNIKELTDENFYHTFINLNRPAHVIETMTDVLSKWKVKKRAVKAALVKADMAMEDYFAEIKAKAVTIIEDARKLGKKIIVIAGRPYHIDPEINHGIHKLITSLGLAVITEDSIYQNALTPKLNVLNQWTYHSRLYRAAEYVTTQEDMQLVQLVSFGCGIDAITTDEVREILEAKGKLYTQLKIDEINNLGAAKIRLRSLVAAMG